MNKFIYVVFGIFIVTFFAAGLAFFLTLSVHDYSISDFCFSSECIDNFEVSFSGTIKIIQSGFSVAWIYVFISGVYIALNNYLTSVKSTALSGHISHLTMFKDYLEGEIEKYGLLKLNKINIYVWYRIAFPLSSKGDIDVSGKYKEAIKKISDAVEETNESINSPKGEFGYRKHQDRMKDVFAPLGVEVSYMPKNDFHNVEFQIFQLIDSVNHTFTDIDMALSDKKRDYI